MYVCVQNEDVTPKMFDIPLKIYDGDDIQRTFPISTKMRALGINMFQYVGR